MRFLHEPRNGRRIVRNNSNEMSATAEVIRRVKTLAGSRAMKSLVFGNHQNADEEEHDDHDNEIVSIGSSSGEQTKTDSLCGKISEIFLIFLFWSALRKIAQSMHSALWIFYFKKQCFYDALWIMSTNAYGFMK